MFKTIFNKEDLLAKLKHLDSLISKMVSNNSTWVETEPLYRVRHATMLEIEFASE